MPPRQPNDRPAERGIAIRLDQRRRDIGRRHPAHAQNRRDLLIGFQRVTGKSGLAQLLRRFLARRLGLQPGQQHRSGQADARRQERPDARNREGEGLPGDYGDRGKQLQRLAAPRQGHEGHVFARLRHHTREFLRLHHAMTVDQRDARSPEIGRQVCGHQRGHLGQAGALGHMALHHVEPADMRPG